MINTCALPRSTTVATSRRGGSPLFYGTSFAYGIYGVIGISIIFYLLQSLGMQSFTAPIDFSLNNWYFIFPLTFGFGAQIGLYRAITLKMHERAHVKGIVVTSGGVSSGAMVACCMHNLALLFPILGLTGAAVFFSTYQNYIFGGSIAIMLVGGVYLYKKYRLLQNSHCHHLTS